MSIRERNITLSENEVVNFIKKGVKEKYPKLKDEEFEIIYPAPPSKFTIIVADDISFY